MYVVAHQTSADSAGSWWRRWCHCVKGLPAPVQESWEQFKLGPLAEMNKKNTCELVSGNKNQLWYYYSVTELYNLTLLLLQKLLFSSTVLLWVLKIWCSSLHLRILVSAITTFSSLYIIVIVVWCFICINE